jgi:phosphatidylinositol 3-kinase
MEALDDPAGGFLAFPPLPFPLDPQIMVTGILADRTVLFKSNALPLKLCFVATDPSAELMLLPVIFKEGDDLRQDQLVLELIGLIDRIWKRNRLDLRLTPYRVLPTAVTTGLVEFVPSQPLRAILADFNGSLRSYFRFLSSSKHHPGGDFDTLPIDPAILENYLRSAAGYSVLTYVLGVGDRHLENLLMTEDGRLFHVDFTFCFGRDPKPFPPPMKLCREMVEAMRSTERNGAELEGPTAEFCQFKAFCFTAFALLRRNARELLACIALLKNCGTTDLGMANASDQSQSHAMPHATVEAGLEVSRATVFVQDRLMLGLSEEEALRELDALIEESVTALFPQVLETIHKWAQYWRS